MPGRFTGTPTRTGFDVDTSYKFHVSFRPAVGYIHVWVTDPNGVIVQDTGDIWEKGIVSSASSRFGVWTFEQTAQFSNSVYRCCDGFLTASGECRSYTTCGSGLVQSQGPTGTSDRFCATTTTTTT